MKKLFILTMVFGAIATTTSAQVASTSTTAPASANSNPQGAPDFKAMLQQAKEKQAPIMVEKTGLTLEQANKVIEINFEMRVAASQLPRDLSEADRSAKIAELKAAKAKKLNELLTPEQLTAVNTFYEDMGKNMQKKANN